MDAAFDCDVLVVGLGPVGAALSGLLAQADVSVIAAERESGVYPLPRAAHIDQEAMRLFQQLGIAEEAERHAQVAPTYDFLNAHGEVLMRFDDGAKRGVSGWANSYMFHQPGVEVALRARLAASDKVDVRLERRLDGLTQTPDGVEAVLTAPKGSEAVRARYIVGCDGARSVVRDACGITLDDYGFDEPWLVLDVRVGQSDSLPGANLQICDPARPTTCVRMGPGRHRWEFMLRHGETAEEAMRDDFTRNLLRPWSGAAELEVERKAVYRFHGLVAESWRKDRAFLAGDAAHQMPPFAGQGMCSGLRDASNLAWKLAAAIHRGAGDTLLDSYQTEREPAVRALIERAIHMGRIVCTADPELAAARDAAMLEQRRAGKAPPLPRPPEMEAGVLIEGSPGAGTVFPQPWASVDGRTLRMDDLLGAGAWLISTGPSDASTAALTCVSLQDPRLTPFRSELYTWLDQHDAPAVLVRPDRCVFGVGPADRLGQAFADQLRAG